MSDAFSKIPIDFSKYRELLSDDNPKIPDDQIISDSFKQNQGDRIGSHSAGNLPQNETTEPSTMDKKKTENSQKLNLLDDQNPDIPGPPIKHIDALCNEDTYKPKENSTNGLEGNISLEAKQNVNPANTYKEEEQRPWEFSENEHPSPTETNNPDQVKAVGYGKISTPKTKHICYDCLNNIF